MATGTAVPWETCADPACHGARGATGLCLAHVPPEAIPEALTSPGGGADLDGRGARFDRAAVARILAAVPTDGAGRRLLGAVRFDQATFEHAVSFDDATFTGPVSMVGTTFNGGARFGGARFDSTADFRGTTFSGQAWFVGAGFAGAASFERARFSGPGWFQRAVFSGAGCFDEASFTNNATFTNARFAEQGSFRGASFEGHARFGGATASGGWDLEGTRLHLEGEGPQDAPPREPGPTSPPTHLSPVDQAIEPPRLRRPWARPRIRRALVPLLVLLFVAATGFVVLRPEHPEADYVPELVEQKGFDFLHEDPVTGVATRYNPCEPIRYAVNTATGPPGWTDELRRAVVEVARATGMSFEEVGDTTELIRPDLPTDMRRIFGWPPEVEAYGRRFQEIFARPSYQPTRYGAGRWSPILVSWVSFGDLNLPYGTQVAAVGASEPRPGPDGNVFVSGALILNADAPIGDLKLLIMHELGHILGLAHVSADTELMHPTFEAQTGFGPGDLEGLRLLGRESGCLPTPPPSR